MSRTLTLEAELDRERFDRNYRNRGCDCFTGCAPCNWCTHPGNPINQEDDDKCWERETSAVPQTPVTILDMERSDIAFDMYLPMADPCPRCGGHNMVVGDYACYGVCSGCEAKDMEQYEGP